MNKYSQPTQIFTKYSNSNVIESFFILFADFNKISPDTLIFKRSFLMLSYFSTFRFFFHRGNQLKSFIIKPYHTGFKAGSFIYTRYQSLFIHTRAKKKKSTSKKRK